MKRVGLARLGKVFIGIDLAGEAQLTSYRSGAECGRGREGRKYDAARVSRKYEEGRSRRPAPAAAERRMPKISVGT